jgi:hypothetical protein
VTEYESAPGWMFHRGTKFACECGNSDFKVEKHTDPTRYWCTCGDYYTEQMLNLMKDDPEEPTYGQ